MHLIILSLWDVHFSLTSQSAFGIFFEELDQTHEPLRARDISGLGGAGS